jgi:hypothetical protein
MFLSSSICSVKMFVENLLFQNGWHKLCRGTNTACASRNFKWEWDVYINTNNMVYSLPNMWMNEYRSSNTHFLLPSWFLKITFSALIWKSWRKVARSVWKLYSWQSAESYSAESYSAQSSETLANECFMHLLDYTALKGSGWHKLLILTGWNINTRLHCNMKFNVYSSHVYILFHIH